jgi:hypothetical protein
VSSIRLADDWDDPGWVSVPRSIARDADLSFKALGIVTYLASHRSGFRLNRDFIISSHRDGKDSVTAGLRELREAGYLTVEQARTEDGKLADGSDYILHRTVCRENRETGNPATCSSATKRDSLKENPTKREDSVTEVTDTLEVDQESPDEKEPDDAPAVPSVKASLPDGFEEFWTAYPRKIAKKAAMSKYRSALKARHSAESIMSGLVRSIAEWKREDRAAEFIPHPATWLNQERFTDGAEERAVPQVADDLSNPVAWLRGEWTASRVDRVQRYYRAVYLPPELDIVEHGRLNAEQYRERVVGPYNRKWIENHQLDILAAIDAKNLETTP